MFKNVLDENDTSKVVMIIENDDNEDDKVILCGFTNSTGIRYILYIYISNCCRKTPFVFQQHSLIIYLFLLLTLSIYL
jgi:hypothetical protein